ncbi:hypothetical protein [Modicisalibacter sp. 'Wilcox']|uniref:hypothetical protein n=1 Tax=Modicisalibacter sp. 'Wilcox' TaxID=2679914 RepID=UPI0013D73A0D|nr:hypothetical protein [Modicisalibacter sp. 'Wilcox']
MTRQDQFNIIEGDQKAMQEASVVIAGVVDLLDGEAITDFHRGALHEALRMAANQLQDRVMYLQNQRDSGGGK